MARAVLFTHIKEEKSLDTAELVGVFRAHRQKFFEACLRCRNIAIVYVYSSYGVEKYVQALLESGTQAKIPIHVLDGEERLHDALQTTVDGAAAVVGGRQNVERVKAHGPKFVFVGVRELACLVSRLQVRNPDLVLSLASKGEFTYDSPKYVEAIIRLVRAADRSLAGDPVIRVDADVEVDEAAIQKIVSAAVTRAGGNAVWWFSGSYRGETMDDPVNAFAVRQHWLIDRKTWTKPRKFALVPHGERFLVDLAEIGATQLVPQRPPEGSIGDPRLSAAGEALVRKRGRTKALTCPQVISGAGLYASPHAIQLLPPFMNAPAMAVWIDDHLKWLLHKALGHFGEKNIVRVPGATMRQNRFPLPDGITETYVAKAPEYFERLLTGCLMEAAIQDARGNDGPLTEAVRVVLDTEQTALAPQKRQALARAVRVKAEERFQDVMTLWRTADYGNDTLKNWALKYTGKKDICDLVVEICVAYVELCILWPQHVLTINKLQSHEAYWAFTKPSPPATVHPPLSPQRIPIKAQAKEKPPAVRRRKAYPNSRSYSS